MKKRFVVSLTALLTLSAVAQANTGTLADYLYLTNAEVSPEGETATFLPESFQAGHTHTNGQFSVTADDLPRAGGLVSSQSTEIANLSPQQYPEVFPGGLVLGAEGVSFDISGSLQRMRTAVQPEHHFSGYAVLEGETLAVSTYLKFKDGDYYVAQYLANCVTAELDANGNPTGIYDTLYVTPGDAYWSLRPLPSVPNEEVIVVEGVCRLEGRVMGRVTVLSADTLFIMDDVYTADANVCANYGTEDLYGIVPCGSSNCIGLVSERDVVIAATPANGAWNGNGVSVNRCTAVMGPAYTGGPACGDITDVTSFSQRNKDVIITAAIIALGCSFEAEFWHTSATASPLPESEGSGQGTQNPAICGCEGFYDSHIAYWPCYGDESVQDNRGCIWMDGSLIQMTKGYTWRPAGGPWGPCDIGYWHFFLRYDRNLGHRAPPMWPVSASTLNYELVLPANIAAVDTLSPWKLHTFTGNGSVGVILQTGLPNNTLPETFSLYTINHYGDFHLINDNCVIQPAPFEITLPDSSTAVYFPFPGSEYWEGCSPGSTIHFELGPGAWNEDGCNSHWTLQAGPVAAEAETLGVTEGVQPVFSEFVQQWNSTTSRLRITERADLVLLARLVDGEGEILAESEFSNNLFELPALDAALFSDDDAYEIHVEVYAPWSDQTWSSAGSISWWYNPDTAVSPNELPQELSLRAFPNPFNPRTTIELALPVAGEVRVELFDLAGRSVRVIRRGEMAAGLYHIPVDGQNLASGLYLLRVEAPDAAGQRQQQVQKLLLVR